MTAGTIGIQSTADEDTLVMARTKLEASIRTFVGLVTASNLAEYGWGSRYLPATPDAHICGL